MRKHGRNKLGSISLRHHHVCDGCGGNLSLSIHQIWQGSRFGRDHSRSQCTRRDDNKPGMPIRILHGFHSNQQHHQQRNTHMHRGPNPRSILRRPRGFVLQSGHNHGSVPFVRFASVREPGWVPRTAIVHVVGSDRRSIYASLVVQRDDCQHHHIRLYSFLVKFFPLPPNKSRGRGKKW